MSAGPEAQSENAREGAGGDPARRADTDSRSDGQPPVDEGVTGAANEDTDEDTDEATDEASLAADGAAPDSDADAHAPDTDPASDLELVQSALRAAQEEARRLEDRFLRARADYDNLVKRNAREREEAQRAAAAQVIEGMVSPIEVLERALLDFAADSDDARVRGLHMAVRQLRDTLEREGLEAVPGAGTPFDHTVHEAIAREEADAPAGTVLEVVRTGYRLNGRLLRPALVKVSTGPPAHGDDAE